MTIKLDIIDAIKTKNLRITNGDKWLMWDDLIEKWVIRQRKYGKRTTTTYLITEFECDAVTALLADDSP